MGAWGQEPPGYNEPSMRKLLEKIADGQVEYPPFEAKKLLNLMGYKTPKQRELEHAREVLSKNGL